MRLRLISLFLCAVLLLCPIAVYADFDIVRPEPTLPQVPIAMPRPRDGEAVILADMEQLEKSTEYYTNFLSMSAEMFAWSEEGIMASTGILTKEHYDYLVKLANELTAGCITSYEKIRSITTYVATNIGFDHDYYTYKTSPYPPSDPYSAVTTGRAVCAGYAKTMEALLQMVGVPCVYIESPGHAWNLIYTGERWMLVDVTWMSNSRYEHDRLYRSEKVNMEWFDFSFTESATQTSHIINKIPYAQRGCVLEAYPIYTSMDHIVWAESVSEVGESAFYGATGFTGDLVIPEGITKIGAKAFYGCTGFDGSLVLPDSLREIGNGAFRNCTGLLGDLVIPGGVEWIENYAFYGCTGLNGKLTLQSGLKIIGTHAFRECKFTGELVLPDGVETIGVFAFSGCRFTGKLVIPSTLSLVARSAFRECGFSEVVIPKAVTEIAAQAFYGCGRLEAVYFEGDAPAIIEYNTENTGSFPDHATLYCRTSAKGWTDSSYYDAQRGTYKGYKLEMWDAAETFTLAATIMTYNPKNSATVRLVSDGEVVHTYEVGATDGSGLVTQEFVIEGVVLGEYDLVITKAGHLSYTVTGITLDCDTVIEDILVLVGGDVNGDGCIDLKDVSALTSSDTYGLTSEDAKTSSADINGDGCFDLLDLTIITSDKNYGKSAVALEYSK